MSTFILFEIKKIGSNSPVKAEIIENIHKTFQDLNMGLITDSRDLNNLGFFSLKKINLDDIVTNIKKLKGYNSVVQNVYYHDTLKKR